MAINRQQANQLTSTGRVMSKGTKDSFFQEFLSKDTCFQISDTFLLAVGLVSFRCANLTLCEHNHSSSWHYEWQENEMEEDLEKPKCEIFFPWALGEDWHSRVGKFHPRDILWARMDFLHPRNLAIHPHTVACVVCPSITDVTSHTSSRCPSLISECHPPCCQNCFSVAKNLWGEDFLVVLPQMQLELGNYTFHNELETGAEEGRLGDLGGGSGTNRMWEGGTWAVSPVSPPGSLCGPLPVFPKPPPHLGTEFCCSRAACLSTPLCNTCHPHPQPPVWWALGGSTAPAPPLPPNNVYPLRS
ncbi:LOW QUALITY PROTEIN: speedy protein C [Urocitellus parryii]